MPQLQAHGLGVTAPSGWEARIFRRPQRGDVTRAAEVPGSPAPSGELIFPVLQAATIPLDPGVADFASDAVNKLGPHDAILVLKEYDPTQADAPLFARSGLSRALDPDAFDPTTLQRRLSGQAGLQQFFHDQARAFCLYVVLGGYRNRQTVVPGVNAVLASVQIDPITAPSTTTSTLPTTSTTSAPTGSTGPTTTSTTSTRPTRSTGPTTPSTKP